MPDPIAENARAFLGAALANTFTTAFFRGVRGDPSPLDVHAAVIEGLKTGAMFTAYPLGQELLQSISSPYKQKVNAKRCTAVETAIAGSAVLTLLYYPAARLEEFHTTGKITLQAAETAEFFIDNILPLVGFPVVTDFLEAKLPPSNHSLLDWGRGQFILAAGGLGGVLAQAPLNLIKGRRIAGDIKEWIAGIGPGIVLSDSAAHFTKLLS